MLFGKDDALGLLPVKKQERMEKLKYQKEIMITAVMAAVIFVLRLLNVFQAENGLAHPLVMLLMIVGSSLLAIWLQRDMDANYAHQRLYYPNLNI